MATFYLIRHATNDLVGKTMPGWIPGVHLNTEGREQARRLAQKLSGRGISRVYSSPLERAMETAEPLALALGVAVERRDALIELKIGEWAGKSFAEIEQDPRWRRFNEHRSATRPPGGELMLETQQRMVAELLCLRDQHAGEAIAVVSHADPIRAVLTYFLGMPLDLFYRIDISPASVSIIKLEEWGAQVLSMNETCG